MKHGFLIPFIFLAAGLAARADISISAKDVATGHYTYQLGWDGMPAGVAGTGKGKPGTFWGDVSASSGFSVANDPAHDVRTVNVRPGETSAWLEFKFDFSRTGKRAVKMSVRDVLRLEPEPGNWATFSALWRAGDSGPWHELRALNGTRFASPGAVTSEVALPAPAAVVYYRVQFNSEKPVTYPWGRGRWNFLTTANAAESCFRVVFDLVPVGEVTKASTLAAAAPPAKVDALATSSPWGVSSHALHEREWDNFGTLIDRLHEGGITYVRTGVQFAHVLSKDGTWNFAKEDQMMDRFSSGGIQVLALLEAFDNELSQFGFGDLVPIWKHPAAWRSYVRATARHYAGRVKAWEIWNEQDGGFWGGKPNAAEYVPLLKIAYEEIKAADPSALVVTGGLESWNTNYLRAMYQAGAKGSFDAVAVHRYGPGPDGSVATERTMREFRALMAEHGQADVPVWITESGGTTVDAPLLAQQPLFMDKAIRYALARIGHPAGGGPLVAGLAILTREKFPGDVPNQRRYLPGVTLQRVTTDRIASLDPATCPVLIADNGLHVDAPMMEPMRSYVQRGGLLVAVGHPPFYVLHTLDAHGIWKSKDASGETYPFFRMGFSAWWTTKGIPKSSNHVAVPAAVVAGGVPQVDGVYVTSFFTGANLEPGDIYQPILSAVNDKGEPVADAIALYTYHDWKGGILAVSSVLDSGWTEQEQAMFLPRMYLSYLASRAGVQKIFIYDLHNDGQNPYERENNFGLTRWDWSPKPSLGAYHEMTQTLGKAPTFVKRLATTNASQWAVIFRRAEDGRLVLAAWSAEPGGAFAVNGAGADWVVEGTAVRYLELAPNANAGALSVHDEASSAPAKN